MGRNTNKNISQKQVEIHLVKKGQTSKIIVVQKQTGILYIVENTDKMKTHIMRLTFRCHK